jgi:outer membrane protein
MPRAIRSRCSRPAAIAQQQSRLDALGRTYYPQFSVQGLVSARGTGLVNNGTRLGGWNGLAPTTQNYGVGLTVTFSAMDRYALQEQEAMEAANLRAGQAQYQVILANLEAQFQTAWANLAGARRVAANTPLAVSAARTTVEQATARYQAGLAPIDDVAQGQRLLVQARIDDSLARLNVWRARLQLDTARGDIQLFLAAAEP